MDAMFTFGCVAVAGVLALIGQVFWLWMFIDCLVKEPSDGNDKILWALVIFFGNLLGAILYFAIRRNERIDRYGQ